MKRNLALILALVMLFSVTGCAKKITNEDVIIESMEAGKKIENMTQVMTMEMTATGIGSLGIPMDEVTAEIELDMKADLTNENVNMEMKAKAMGMSFDFSSYVNGDEVIYKAPGSPVYIKMNTAEMEELGGASEMPNLDMTEFTEASEAFTKHIMEVKPEFMRVFIENSDQEAVKEEVIVNEEKITAYKSVFSIDNQKIEQAMKILGDYLQTSAEGRLLVKDLFEKYPVPIVELMQEDEGFTFTEESFDADLILMGEMLSEMDLTESSEVFTINKMEIVNYYNEKFQPVKYYMNMDVSLTIPETTGPIGLIMEMNGEVYDINNTVVETPEIPEDEIMTMEEYEAYMLNIYTGQ